MASRGSPSRQIWGCDVISAGPGAGFAAFARCSRLLGDQFEDRDDSVSALLVFAEPRGALDDDPVDRIPLVTRQFTRGRRLCGFRYDFDLHLRVGADIVHPRGIFPPARRGAYDVNLAVNVEVS